jgi:hypothetical protein
MKRLITGFGLFLALLATLGALDLARAGLNVGPPFLKGQPQPGQPQPGPDGNTPVWRAQLRIRVCDVDNAGTDNKVLASLNNANSTVMDTPINDLERGSEFTYDLLLNGVARLADIGHLRISKGGSNGICLGQLTLLVNERQIYSRVYSQGLWLDNTCYGCDFTLIPGATLRTHSSWLAWTAPSRPRLLSSSEIGARLATAIGTGMYNFNVQSSDSMSWYSSPWAEFVDSLAIAVYVRVDFKCIDPVFGDGGCRDSTIQYWAVLRFSCNPAGAIVVTKEDDGGHNMSGNTQGVTGSPAEMGDIRQYVGPQLAQAFRNIAFPTCSPIVVQPVNSGTRIDVEVQL